MLDTVTSIYGIFTDWNPALKYTMGNRINAGQHVTESFECEVKFYYSGIVHMLAFHLASEDQKCDSKVLAFQ